MKTEIQEFPADSNNMPAASRDIAVRIHHRNGALSASGDLRHAPTERRGVSGSGSLNCGRSQKMRVENHQEKWNTSLPPFPPLKSPDVFPCVQINPF